MADVKVIMTGCPVRTNFGVMAIPTIVLIDGEKKTLYDVGGYHVRHQLFEGLAKHNLTTANIDRVILSHLHWDHALFMEPFAHAEVIVSKKDHAAADDDKTRDSGTPPFMTRLLDNYKLTMVNGGEVLEDGVRLIEVPGHTAGGLVVECRNEKGLHIIAGDAIGHVCNLILGQHDRGWYNQAMADEGMKMLANLGGTIYPAHDRPFVYQNGQVTYREPYEITIKCRFGLHGEFTDVKIIAP